MDESTFEMFEEELGMSMQDVPILKHHRQVHQTGMYSQRRGREVSLDLATMAKDSPIVQQIPKGVPYDAAASGTPSLHKPMSVQNVAQLEVPWEGVTLNRCLFIAITILVLTTGCQRISEAIRGHKDGDDTDDIRTALNVRHAAVRRGRLPPPQPETALWDTFFWWVSDDDDKVEESTQCRSRRATQERASRGLRHKTIPNRNLLKRKEDRFKARRKKAGHDEETKEKVKREKAMEEGLRVKKLEERGPAQVKEEVKIPKKKTKESKKTDKKIKVL